LGQATTKVLPWAAILVLALGLSLVWQGRALDPEFGIQEIATSAGETATVVLGDGTVVRLGSESRLTLHRGQSGRQVALRGTAYFAVARNEEVPFLIQTPAGDVRVLGTRFDLSAGGSDLRVRVVEGRVVLALDAHEEMLEAGQIGRVMEGRVLPTETVDDPAAQIDWMGSFLAFQGTPLPEAVREIGRAYGISVELMDPTLADRTVTSHFSDWDLPTLIEALCLIVYAECALEGDVLRMVSRPLP
jgi:transmembrane sensor